MANYATSNLVAAQAKLIAAFQAAELRYTSPRTYLELLAQAPGIFPDANGLRTREDRTVNTYYKKRTSRALGSARSHSHTGSAGDAGILALSWTPYTDQFSYTLKQGDTNVYSLDEMLMGEVENLFANMMEGLESAATTFLFSNRTGINTATLEGAFNHTTDVFEIDTADENRATQITKIVLDINKYGGNYVVFCDSIAYNKFQYQAAQGISNATNLSFQFGGVTFIHSVDLYALTSALGNTLYTKGSWIAVPVGMAGALTWIPKQNRQGIVTSVNEYSTLINPVDGQTYAIHKYEERANGTSVNGYTQDVLTQIEASIDVAFEHAPLATAGASPLLAFALVDSLSS